MDVQELNQIMKRAGEVLMEFNPSRVSRERKPDGSLVSEADFAVDDYLRKHLPKHPVLSEESADNRARLSHERVWIVDPLDGTADFLEGGNEFSIIVGRSAWGFADMGAVYNPCDDTLYFAQSQRGAWMQQGSRNPVQIRVSERRNLSDIVLAVPGINMPEHDLKSWFGARTIRRWGSFGLMIASVANGESDASIYGRLFSQKVPCEWDSCGPEAILVEAGGIITDEYGVMRQYNSSNPDLRTGVIASNKSIYPQLLGVRKELRGQGF